MGDAETSRQNGAVGETTDSRSTTIAPRGGSFKKHLIAGVPFTVATQSQMIERLLKFDKPHESFEDFHFIATHPVSLAQDNSELMKIFTQSNHVLPDSRWLQFLTFFSREKLQQVRGPDFFRKALEVSKDSSSEHFFVAPSEEVGQALMKTLASDFPELPIAGWIVAPMAPFSDEHIEDLVQEIGKSDTSITWIGVGSPAQNFLAHRLAQRKIGKVCAVGAGFEYLSGLKAESPRWISYIGAEWFFRLLSEPKRLWRRYTVDIGRFLCAYARGPNGAHTASYQPNTN